MANEVKKKMSLLKRVMLSFGGLAVIALVVGLVFFQSELKGAFKLLFKMQPVHAKHIPGSAFVVSRTNLAAIALKTGLRESSNDPLNRKVREYGAKLYPRFDQLMADPQKESGIEVADDVYIFSELVNQRNPAVGLLFGISDKQRFADFIQRIRPGAPQGEGGISIVRLDNDSVLCWNKSFALLYAGLSGDALLQRAKAIMTMDAKDGILATDLKKDWLAGRDDVLVSVDLGRLTSIPEIGRALSRTMYPPEMYAGSSVQCALNFDKGKFTIDTRATGDALLAEMRKTAVPPTREFLSGIQVGNYQAFIATHVPFARIVESFRQAYPEQFAQTNETLSRTINSSIEGMAESLTGDVCFVLQDISQQTMMKSPGRDPWGTPLPPVKKTGTRVDGTLAIGIKPDSVVERLVHGNLQNAPPGIVEREGAFYTVHMGAEGYLLAGNGYLALTSSKDAIKAMAGRKKGDAAVMPKELLEQATDGTGLLEIKLGPLFTSLSGISRLPGESRMVLEVLGSRLKELRVFSRLEKDCAASRLELLFQNQYRNSLNQFVEMSMFIADNAASEYRSRRNNAAALSDLRNAKTSLDAYRVDHQQYPSSLADANFKASDGVSLSCSTAPTGFTCVAKHREGNRLYATVNDDPVIRTRSCAQGEVPGIPVGAAFESLERLN